MRLWLLRPVGYDQEDFWKEAGAPAFQPVKTNPWSPWYDKTFGLVIRAETEAAARQMAVADAGGDSDGWSRKAWLDPTNSTCVELTTDGESGIIIADVHSS